MLDTFKDIREGGQRIPYELTQRLVLLHSYQLAKRKVKMGDHMGAARLLVRVCQNISQFPQNMTNIMTTCIGECSQAGLKQQAYQQACVLIRPENIDQIPPKFKTRIESIARRPVKTDDPAEELTPCPFCKFHIPEYTLDCPNCKRNLPFCCASGKHMVLQDWSSDPPSKMPANYQELKKMLEFEALSPICDKPVNPMQVTIANDCEAEFKALADLMKDSSPDADDDEEEEDRALIS
jgi:WD repeat-containing protein 19